VCVCVITLNVWGQCDFFQKEILLIQQGCIKVVKSDSKDICDVKKIFQFQRNAVIYNFLLRILEKKVSQFPQKILNSIDNNKKCGSNQHIRIISDGSCDTLKTGI